jgi:hypothetical protein
VIDEFQLQQFECGWVNNVDTPTTKEMQGVPMYRQIQPTDGDITDRAIQVGGAREGQSFVFKYNI